MVVAKVDSAILRSDEMWELWERYEKKFGKKCAAQVYKEELEKCLREGKPTSIISKWCQPGSLIDH